MTDALMSRTRGVRSLFVALGLTVAHVAQGQAANQSLVLEAVAAKERAIDSGRSEDWRSTLRLFRLAHQARPSAEAAYEIGVAASALHQDDLAFDAYSEALELGLTEVAHEKATNFLAVHRSRLARLQLRCSSGSRVLVRGVERGRAPLARPIVALPGVARIECHPTSGEALHREVTLFAGEEQLVALDAPEEQASSASDPSMPDPNTGASRRESDAERPVFGRALSRGTLLWTESGRAATDQAARSEALRTTTRSPAVAPLPRSQRGLGWLFVGPGTTLFVWSGTLALLASSQIGEGRHALANSCAAQADGPDTCRYAKAGQQLQAQGHSDSIATWKAVRAASLTSAGLGLAASAVGVGMLTGLIGGNAQDRQSAQLVVSQTGVTIEIRTTFE